MRVLITGGGTGGHLYPALSVAGLLQELDNRCQILFVGTGEGLKAEWCLKEVTLFAKLQPESGREKYLLMEYVI